MKILIPKINKKRIYLDYASSAPLLRSVKKAVGRADALFANPSSIHADGLLSKEMLASARQSIAGSLGAHRDEVVLMGSGTESDNLAIIGTVKAFRTKNPGREAHIVTSVIEHPAVLEACRALEREGVTVTYLDVSSEGVLDTTALARVLRPETVLVSIAYANNEIGVVAPIREVVKIVRRFKKEHDSDMYPLVHTDACQAPLYLDVNTSRLGVDLLSLNGTKLGAPHGTGVLFVRRGTPIEPLIYGGGQEGALRSGTENISGAVGLAEALRVAVEDTETRAESLTAVRDFFVAEITKQFPSARINGTLEERLPNNVNISLPNISSELLVLELDARGISVSAGSACASAKDAGSHVLSALYGPQDADSWGSIRFSFCETTTRSELSRALRALASILKKYEPWKSA